MGEVNMATLERTVENLFSGKFRFYLDKIKLSIIGKIAICSLAGILNVGCLYGCDESKNIVQMPDSLKEIEENKEELPILCWDKTLWGGGSSFSFISFVQQTKDGGYVAAGTKNGSVGILKLGYNGDLEWEKAFEIGWAAVAGANQVQQTNDGGYILVGYNQGYNPTYPDSYQSDARILKVDAKGSLEWDKTFVEGEEDEANSVQQTVEGKYLVAGQTQSKGAGMSDAWILLLNSKGDLEWDKTFGGKSTDWISSLSKTKDGGYIAAGGTPSKNGVDCVWVLKFDSSGTLEWDKTYEWTWWSEAFSIQQTKDEGYIVGGWTYGSEEQHEDGLVFKLNSKGELKWGWTFGDKWTDSISSISQTEDGGYIASGREYSHGAGNDHGRIFKFDSKGILKWEKTFSEEELDYAKSIQQTNDGGYIVAGDADPNGVKILKLDSKGDLCK